MSDLKTIYKLLRNKGYTITKPAYEKLCRFLKSPENSKKNMVDLLNAVLENIQKDKKCKMILETDDISRALDKLYSNYKKSSTIFLSSKIGDGSNLSDENFIERKFSIFANRFNKLLKIAKKGFASSNGDIEKHQITLIENLSDKNLKETVIFGILNELEHNHCHLEDDSGFVEIDFEENVVCNILTWGSFVALKGFYDTENEIFSVQTILALNRFEDKIGTNSNLTSVISDENRNTKKYENSAVILSEIYLDCPETENRLKRLFQRFEQSAPKIFVLMGNFLYRPQKNSLKKNFEKLGKILEKFDNISAHSDFVFLPGPTDIFSKNILPRPPLGKFSTQPLSKIIKFANKSSPCKLSIDQKQVIFLRENIFSKISRNCCLPPNGPFEKKSVSQTYSELLFSQRFCAPFSHSVQRLSLNNWELMQIEENKQILFIGDQYEQFKNVIAGCGSLVVGIGQFGIDSSYAIWRLNESIDKNCVEFAKTD